jgi:short-subunit dehydrogenase
VGVITIKPGPVRTPMTDDVPVAVQLADPRRVASDIVRALAARSPDILYTPPIWRFIMAAIRLIPESLFKRLPL